MSSVLGESEILNIAHPLTQPAAIVRYFNKIGIRATRRPDGSVLVLREWLAEQPTPGTQSRPRIKSEKDHATA